MKRVLPFLCVLFGILAAGCARTVPGYEAVVRDHLARYPAMEAADLYKLCHQAAMGSAHLGADTAMVYDYLLRELAGLDGDGAAEPLVEALSPGGDVVRVNLRPFQARGGDPDALFHALMRSWETLVPSPDALRACTDAARAAAGGPAAAALDTLVRTMAAEGYPAVHHSDAYAARYRPAYRVVVRRHLRGLPE